MSYLSAKKIYPGNFNEPLNGWYKNIDTNDSGTNDASNGGPTSVLANPGWQFYQLRGYVPVTTTGFTASASVIIPSPYRNDDTRTDITGMVVSADSTRPAYVYRTNISVASGWGDGRVAESGLMTDAATQVVAFGPAGPVSTSGVVEGANLVATSNNIAAGSAGYGTNPFQNITGIVTKEWLYEELTTDTTFEVYSKATTNGTALNGGFGIHADDVAAGRKGYILVEVCYIRPDTAVAYADMEQYLPNRTVS
jgi:hypothetical protein